MKYKLIIFALSLATVGVSFFWSASRNPGTQLEVAEQAPVISNIQKKDAPIVLANDAAEIAPEKKTESPAQKSVSTAIANIATSSVTLSSATFSFAIQADPHMDEQSDAATYTQTLKNIVSAHSSFLVDLGDIFMIDKLTNKSEVNIRSRYELMKGYYDLLGSIPVYQVMGNHDGETGWDALYTKNYRLEYFPEQNKGKNYYSFEKNGALFVMLDPYTYTTQKPNSNGWLWTLGKAQYDWLKNVLETSSAKHKFVFIHQLVGGDSQGRGGTELAKYYEWGGYNLDGTYGFDAKRSGWGKPIHELLVQNNVSVVFKGHDHFYDKQELDGVVYQTLPQPSHPGDKVNTATEYGYLSGDIVGGSGYLNVSVADSGVTVKFIKANSSQEVIRSYTVK
ncbi:MAG: metallophosphoesterase [bacterium]